MQIYVNRFAQSFRCQLSNTKQQNDNGNFSSLDEEPEKQREKAEVDSNVNHVRVITYGGDHKFVPNGNYKVRLKCCSDDEQKTQGRRTETSMTGRVKRARARVEY